jgi:hypothetical protein
VPKDDAIPSAAPIPGTEAMHEFLREPADKAISRAPASPSRVVVMATHEGIARPAINFADFRLLKNDGQELARIADSAIAGQAGRSRTFSLDVEEGGYILEGTASGFDDQALVRQPILCSRGWCTVVFLGMKARTGTPDLSTASIYLWRLGSHFALEQIQGFENIQDSVLSGQRDTELALRSLQSGRNQLSLEEINKGLLFAKFENPMLGILGCHLLLQQPNKDAPLIETVIRNLDALIPAHADVAALKALAHRAGIKQVGRSVGSIAWPPMLREGFRALRDADWVKPGTIQEFSLFDRVRARLAGGGAWTRWIAGPENEFAPPPPARRPRSAKADPAIRARTLGIVLHDVLTFTKLLQPAKLRPEDLMSTGLSRRQAGVAATLANRNIAARAQKSAVAPKRRPAATTSKPVKAAKPLSKGARSAPSVKTRERSVAGKTPRKHARAPSTRLRSARRR